jgi:WD40 repeat protein
MVPERRLEVLVEQALTAQLSAAMFHNRATAAVSLLTDYRAGTEHIPTRTVQVLQEHNDEVWHVAFSPDGTQLASSSKDGTACVWQVSPRGGQRLVHRHTLRGHSGPVVFVAWSPDGSKLATCGNDGRSGYGAWPRGPAC